MEKEMKPCEIRKEGRRLFEKHNKKQQMKKSIKNLIELAVIYMAIGIACGFGVTIGTKLTMFII